MYLNADKGNKEKSVTATKTHSKRVCKSSCILAWFSPDIFWWGLFSLVFYPQPSSCFYPKPGNLFCLQKQDFNQSRARFSSFIVTEALKKLGDMPLFHGQNQRRDDFEHTLKWPIDFLSFLWYSPDLAGNYNQCKINSSPKIGLSTVTSIPQILFWKLFGGTWTAWLYNTHTSKKLPNGNFVLIYVLTLSKPKWMPCSMHTISFAEMAVHPTTNKTIH